MKKKTTIKTQSNDKLKNTVAKQFYQRNRSYRKIVYDEQNLKDTSWRIGVLPSNIENKQSSTKQPINILKSGFNTIFFTLVSVKVSIQSF